MTTILLKIETSQCYDISMVMIMLCLQVASVVGRAEVVCCIFFLLSLLSYCKAISDGCGSSLVSSNRTRWRLVTVSLFFSFCSMLSKEQGVVVIGVCACFDIVLHWQVLWQELFAALKDRKKKIKGGGEGAVGEKSSDTNTEENGQHKTVLNGQSHENEKIDQVANHSGPQRINGITVTMKYANKTKRPASPSSIKSNRSKENTALSGVVKRIGKY